MNWSTLIVAFFVTVIVLAIVVNEVRKKKSGKDSCACGGSCGGCSLQGTCHPKK